MYKHLQAYLSKEIYPFHMPGHKRNPMFFPPRLPDLDLTEIPGMDVLRSPSGILRDLQAKISGFYNSDESFLLVNGSTSGIIAAICATVGDGGKLYAARNGHVSMYSGMALSGAAPVYVQPEVVPYRAGTADGINMTGIMGGINPSMLEDMEEGAAVIIVSPTYEGFVSDVQMIAEKVHSQGGILIVDEAHGAHFPFHDTFPDSALALGADIIVHSLHKTLPVLGQMAVLHVKGPRVDVGRLKYFLHGLTTTSPSYMLMAQLDYVLEMLWRRPELFDMYVDRLSALRKALAHSESGIIMLTGTEFVGRHGIHDIDRGKLLFELNANQSAEELSKMLADKYRIQVEMAKGRHLLAMTSVADTDEGMQRLWAAVGAVNIRLGTEEAESPGTEPDTAAEGETGHPYPALEHEPLPVENPPEQNIPIMPTPVQVLSPRQATMQPTDIIPWDDAAGRIAGEVIAAYPPGIALVAPGERIPQGLPKLVETVRVIREIL